MLHRCVWAAYSLSRPASALFVDGFFSAACTKAARLRLLSCGPTSDANRTAPWPPPPALPPLEPWPDAASHIERAATPPSSWYTSPAVLQLEERTVFRRSWLAVARSSRLAAPGAYVAGSLLSLQWLVCRDERGQLHAFHNVRWQRLGTAADHLAITPIGGAH